MRTISQYWRAVRALFRGLRYYFLPPADDRRIGGLSSWYGVRARSALGITTGGPLFSATRQIQLWVDTEAFPRIFKLINQAQHTIFIQMFIWKDDTIGRRTAELLLRAADRGVKVEISKEAIGDVFESHRDFLATRNQAEPLWHRFWTHPNILITYASNNDHAKVYVIDGSTLLLTGMNISNEYHEDWHDYLVELHGSEFVTKYLTRGEISPDTGRVQLVVNTETTKEIRPVLMQLIESARHSILIEHCFISDPEVLSLLTKKTRGGVRVTIITPEKTELFHHFSNMESVSELIRNTDQMFLNVFLYPKFFHAKILLVDRRNAFIGSANLMKSSLDEMGEVNVLITRPSRSVVKLRDVLRGDILKSKLLTNPSRFPWLLRWLAWLKL